MEETVYSVSEAVRLVGVESHVLRYWEEELKLPIRRSAQGHRLYSESDIRLLCRVREWKKKGLQLKAIRVLLDESVSDEARTEFGERVRAIAYNSGAEEECEAERSSEEQGCVHTERESDEHQAEASHTAQGMDEHQAEASHTAQESDAHQAVASHTAQEMDAHQAAASHTAQETNEHQAEDSHTAADAQPLYEILPAQAAEGNLEKVVAILRQMMEEVVAEQNKKLEKEIAMQLRSELELSYLQYIQALQEASAAREQPKPGPLRQLLRKLFPEA